MKTKLTEKLRGDFLQGFVIYLGSTVLNKAIPFLLLPILTRYLSPAEYGLLAMYQVLISFGNPLVGMALHVHIGSNYFRVEKEELSKITSNALFILTTTSTFLLIALWIYTSFGGNLFSIPEKWILALPLVLFMNMINQFNLTLLRSQKKALRFGIFEISKTAVDLGISLVLVVVYLLSWEGRVIGIVISSILLGVVSLLHIIKQGYFGTKLSKKVMRDILGVSLPLIPHSMGVAVITLSDRLFIDQMISNTAVGIYTVGYQFGMIMSLVVIAFNRTWSPWVYEKLAQDTAHNKKKIVRATYFVAVVLILVSLAINELSKVLLPLMTDSEYHSAVRYVFWVSLGYAFYGFYTLVFPYGVHVGKTSYLGITTFFAALVNLIGNYYLIKWNGPIGAAQSTLISYLIMFLMVWWNSNKLFPMPWFTWMKG
ncbi:MAG: O-antigen/teichoic acid export membrane protein [Parvicella sp.]|jgi:O-antigen/teichoic acid export membrane protein